MRSPVSTPEAPRRDLLIGWGTPSAKTTAGNRAIAAEVEAGGLANMSRDRADPASLPELAPELGRRPRGACLWMRQAERRLLRMVGGLEARSCPPASGQPELFQPPQTQRRRLLAAGQHVSNRAAARRLAIGW